MAKYLGLVLAALAADEASARFLSSDPVPADPDTGTSFNRYAYADNNPYRYADPDGRAAQALWGAPIGATTSIVVQMVASDGSLSKRFDSVNWAQVGVATAAGALSGGVSAIASTATTTGGVIAANVVGNAAVGAVATQASAQIEGTTAPIADVAIGAVVGGGSAGAASSIMAAPGIAARSASNAMTPTQQTATANLLGGIRNATPDFKYTSPAQTLANAASATVSVSPDLAPVLEDDEP